MPDFAIPAPAVEAGAHALTEKHEVPAGLQPSAMVVAGDVLTAAAPYIVAAAFRQAAVRMLVNCSDPDDDWCYHRSFAGLLRQWADEIESARGAAEIPATLMAATVEGEAEIAGWAVEPPALARPPSWWHAYGAVPTKGEHAGCWVQIIVGPGGLSPDGRTRRPIPLGSSGVMLPYLRSWDHEPTDEETAALHPSHRGG